MAEKLSEIQLRYKRVRRLKALLRPLPRRTNLHRYPVLKWIAPLARRCSYIWSFKSTYVISAFYIGWIIALIPMYGLQMICAFLFCLLLRGNCIVAMLLQWITNPLTIPFIIVFQYKLGDWFIVKFFGANPKVGAELLAKLKGTTFETLLADLWSTISDWSIILHLVAATLLGGLLVALTGAVISHISYVVYVRMHRYDNTTPLAPIRKIKHEKRL